MWINDTVIGALCATALGACASVPVAPVAAAPAYPHLERVCVSAEGLTGRVTALSAFAVDTPGGRPVVTTAARECFFPWVETAGWARVETAAPDRKRHDEPAPGEPGASTATKNYVFGMAEDGLAHPTAGEASAPLGAASFDIDETGSISHATLGGPLTVSWRWDDAGRTLARLDLGWRDTELSVGGKLGGTTRVHVARAAGGGALRVWESTVFGDADSDNRLHEAWVADGPIVTAAPTPLAMSGIHPICPLSAREQWEDFDGVAPRVQKCLRAGVEWLRIERDPKGRITTIAERRAQSDRTIRFEWHDGAVPSRVWVESGGLADGLDVRFDDHALPTVTRHYRLGRQEGLEVEWQRGRAKAARIWVDGTRGPERGIIDRTTSIGMRDQPQLTIDIPVLPSGLPAGAWLDLGQ
ncbi:MAG: hypothetical protein U1F43_10275 [Myxococcota bacterium]